MNVYFGFASIVHIMNEGDEGRTNKLVIFMYSLYIVIFLFSISLGALLKDGIAKWNGEPENRKKNVLEKVLIDHLSFEGLHETMC